MTNTNGTKKSKGQKMENIMVNGKRNEEYKLKNEKNQQTDDRLRDEDC